MRHLAHYNSKKVLYKCIHKKENPFIHCILFSPLFSDFMTGRARLLLLFHTPGICCFLFAFALSNSLQMKKDKGPVKHDADNSFSLTKEYQEKKEEVKQITTTATKNERHNNATSYCPLYFVLILSFLFALHLLVLP